VVDAEPAPSGAVESFEFLPLLRDRPDSGRDWQPGATRVRCPTCGTSMDYPAYLAGRNCDSCGSPALVACDATGAPVHPSAIVPFGLPDGELRDRVAAWLKTKRPSAGARGLVVDTVRAVYVPCWTFSARVRVPWRAERYKTNRDGEQEHETIGGVIERTFEDEVAPASASLPLEHLREIDLVSTSDLRPYDPRYLAGYDIELYAVNLWDAWDPVDARMQERVDRSLQRAAGSTAQGLESWPEWSGQRCRHVLAPVYAVSYRLRREQHVALVHGRSGSVAGTYPNDPVALAIGVAILLGFAGAIVLLVILVVRWLF
jgi:hypothetical protein